MRELRRFDLDARALEYFRTQLHGINAFCTALEALVDGSGEMLTFAPPETAPERLYHFKEGGLLPENPRAFLEDGSSLSAVSNLKREESKWLWDQLGPAVCIVDDFNPRWSDLQTGPNLKEVPRVFGVGEEVYHLLRHGDGADALHRALVDGETIWHRVAAVCPLAPTIAGDRTASLEDLQASAASATVITCTAYDGEGFVAWQRK